MSRTHNSIRNIAAAILGQILIILVGFIARKLFIIFLPTSYLGLNGLFSSVLTVLSLAELGLGPAMIFSLYKPLASNDLGVCQALMQLYRKLYRYIGLTVLIVGLVITPLIPRIIKEIPSDVSNIQLIYVFFVLNAAISYFFSYKRSFIIASQNQYQIDLTHTLVYLVMNGVQILVLVLTRSYILFLVAQILATYIENLLLSRWADRKYSWLIKKTTQSIPRNIKGEIVKNVKAMVFHRIGGIVMDATDSILISNFFGLSFLALYSNYLLVINAVKSVTQSFFSGITASIGDFGAQNDHESSHQLYRKIQFFNFWLSVFCSICLFVLVNPFISIVWLGKEFLIPLDILAVIVANFYINSMRRTVLTFKEAYGLPWHDRYKPIVGAIVNLVVSIALATKMGIVGVFLGTTITHLTINVWLEAWVIFQHGFHKPLSIFIKEYLLQAVVLLISLAVVLLLGKLIPSEGYLRFSLLTLICLTVPNFVIWLLYRRSEEYMFVAGLVRLATNKLRRR